MKRIIILLLTIFLISLGIFTACGTTGDSTVNDNDSVDGDNTEPIKYSEGLEYKFNDNYMICYVIGRGTCTDSVIVMPPTQNGYTVHSIYPNAFEGDTLITEVVIPEGVIGINKSAFSGCEALTKVTLPDGFRGIYEYAFEGCTDLKTIRIPDSIEEVAYNAFYDCPLEFNDYLGNKYLGNEKNPYALLYQTTSDTEANIHPDTKMLGNNTFEYSDVKEVELPEGLRVIGFAFSKCYDLKRVKIPSSVIILNKAFHNCSSLETAELSAGITSLSAFLECENLKKIIFNGTKTQWDAMEKELSNQECTVVCTDETFQMIDNAQ